MTNKAGWLFDNSVTRHYYLARYAARPNYWEADRRSARSGGSHNRSGHITFQLLV